MKYLMMKFSVFTFILQNFMEICKRNVKQSTHTQESTSSIHKTNHHAIG